MARLDQTAGIGWVVRPRKGRLVVRTAERKVAAKPVTAPAPAPRNEDKDTNLDGWGWA